MIALREATIVRRWPDVLRWAMCLLLALCLHAAGVALFLRWNDSPDLVADAPIITVELAVAPVAPDVTPTEIPPGPQQAEAQPAAEPQEAVDKPDLKLDLVKEADLPAATPVEKVKEKKLKQQRASLASAPSTAEQRAERAAARVPGAASHNPNAAPSWRSALVARLERYKRYPAEAQSRGEHGVAQLAFSVDRSGGVHHAHIVRGSGSNALDRETLAMVERAAPMPPPPPEITGAQIPIVVPVRYTAR